MAIGDFVRYFGSVYRVDSILANGDLIIRIPGTGVFQKYWHPYGYAYMKPCNLVVSPSHPCLSRI